MIIFKQFLLCKIHLLPEIIAFRGRKSAKLVKILVNYDVIDDVTFRVESDLGHGGLGYPKESCTHFKSQIKGIIRTEQVRNSDMLEIIRAKSIFLLQISEIFVWAHYVGFSF